MTDRATLLALAERCEQAAGPDRELDAEIARFLVLAGAEDIARSRYGWSYFTASLDAAVTLVPEGWKWSLDWTQRAPYLDCAVAAAFAHGSGINPADTEAAAKTTALALCAAALRARAAAHD